MKGYIFAFAMMSLSSASLADDFITVPRHDLTPGATRDLSIQTICETKWGSDTRGVTTKMKQDVMEAYSFDIKTCPLSNYKGKRVRRVEIDHLIPRSIGGADDVRNLWPQCYEPVNADKSKQPDGAHKKDRLETYMHKHVCETKSPTLLKEYQSKVSNDWRGLYREIYGDD